MQHPSFGPYTTVFIRGGAQGLEDLQQGNRNVTTDMEKAEVLVESDENTQGAWTYLQRRLVKREKHCSL